MEIVRQTRKLGNSAGVLLPKNWLNAIVKISIINSLLPDEIMKSVDLKVAEGVYLSGSYARDEQTIDSDVDILVITEDVNRSVKKGKYEISYIPEKNLNGMNALIYYPMLVESKTIINEPLKKRLIEKIKEKLYSEYLTIYLKNTKEMLSINEKEINLLELKKEKYVDNSVGYSLILRLRTYYILDCLKKNKLWSKKGFLDIIKKITGSESAYKSYLNAKNNKGSRILKIEEAQKILNHLKNVTKTWEKEKKE